MEFFWCFSVAQRTRNVPLEGLEWTEPVPENGVIVKQFQLPNDEDLKTIVIQVRDKKKKFFFHNSQKISNSAQSAKTFPEVIFNIMS